MVRLGDLIKLGIFSMGWPCGQTCQLFLSVGYPGRWLLLLSLSSPMPDFTNSNSLHWSYEERRLQESIDNRPFNDLAFLLCTQIDEDSLDADGIGLTLHLQDSSAASKLLQSKLPGCTNLSSSHQYKLCSHTYEHS